MTALPIPVELGDQPLTDDELATVHLVGDPDVELPEAVVRFTVTDDGAAEWCMRHVARIDLEAAAAADQYEIWKAQLDDWLAQKESHLRDRRAFFAGHLERYAIARREADPKAKTLRLPSGTVATTERKPMAELPFARGTAGEGVIVQPVIAWLRETFDPDVLAGFEVIKVQESILKTGLRKLLVIWLEVITVDGDGLEVEESRRWLPMLGADGKPTKLGAAEVVVARYAVPPVNPATGEAWSDDIPVPDRAAPIIYVSAPSIDATVKPVLP